MRKLFYVPLEPYRERYTWQLSAPVTGWLERRWREAGVDYVRVEGRSLTEHIEQGSVLDACGRGYWAASQVMELLRLLRAGELTGEDVVYFDDFWHPGISALPYAFHLLGVRPKMYALLHAQSVDPFDFTYPMRHWMRHFEIGIGKVLDGIFVTSTCLKDLCVYAGIGTEDTVHVTGLPYCSEEVKSRFPAVLPKKKKQVIYTSRWDREKRPDVFLRIVEEVVKVRKDIKFLITTSAPRLRSNEPRLLRLLSEALERFGGQLELKEGLSKEEYYYCLLESKIQVNTSDQDFVSWTLLEATTCGCRPLYPYFLSFPEALCRRDDVLYVKNDVKDAARRILKYIDEDPPQDWSWVYSRFDKSWQRMLQVMEGGKISEPLYSGEDGV